jgi:hypothetical protein
MEEGGFGILLPFAFFPSVHRENVEDELGDASQHWASPTHARDRHSESTGLGVSTNSDLFNGSRKSEQPNVFLALSGPSSAHPAMVSQRDILPRCSEYHIFLAV